MLESNLEYFEVFFPSRERRYEAAGAVAGNELCLGTASEYNTVLRLFSSNSFLTEGYQKKTLPHGVYQRTMSTSGSGLGHNTRFKTGEDKEYAELKEMINNSPITCLSFS